MHENSRGVIAAGHPVPAGVGAEVLREGGNAVDAAVAAVLASFVAEPLLTGLAAGGYMLVAGGGHEPALLDFMVAAPTRDAQAEHAELDMFEVSFGDATQVFYGGPAASAVYGAPAGVCDAVERWGTLPLADLVEPARRMARTGVELNAGQAYVAKILEPMLRFTAECSAIWAPRGRIMREGERIVNPDLAAGLALLASEGAEPFYTGEVALAVCDWLSSRGGAITRADLASYRAVLREPVAMPYRDRTILTNPPPSAGGVLIAYSLGLLDREPSPPSLAAVLHAMAAAQGERTADFLEGLSREGFLADFLALKLGSTTHISVLDGDGMACSVTTTNGEGSGVVVPGTGVHLNNMMGEQDLNPLGFHRHPAGRRLPSMMAPSLVMRGGEVEMVLGSAGSNRIRSAILQTVVSVVDHGMSASQALAEPRVHLEDGVLFAEPGVDVAGGPDVERIVHFGAPNLFFGGVQAVVSRGGRIEGAGDPRRGGVAVSA